jgi:methylmalonyl-CoA/ethylmalonyl-CoA epimerase
MHPREVHHIGHAIADLDAAVDLYERLLGAVLEHRETLAEQGVDAASMRVGRSRVELLAPLAADTPVGRFLERRGPGMHHVAYEVGDIERALADARSAGAQLIDERPRRGILGLRVAFIHPESAAGVLVELVQPTIGEADA